MREFLPRGWKQIPFSSRFCGLPARKGAARGLRLQHNNFFFLQDYSFLLWKRWNWNSSPKARRAQGTFLLLPPPSPPPAAVFPPPKRGSGDLLVPGVTRVPSHPPRVGRGDAGPHDAEPLKRIEICPHRPGAGEGGAGGAGPTPGGHSNPPDEGEIAVIKANTDALGNLRWHIGKGGFL